MADKRKRIRRLEDRLGVNDPKKRPQIINLHGDETEEEVRKRDGIERRDNDIVIQHGRWD